MASAAVAACLLLLVLGLLMRLLGVAGGDAVLTVAFIYLVTLPVVRLLWALVVLARSGQWRFVVLGLVVIGLLLSTFFLSAP